MSDRGKIARKISVTNLMETLNSLYHNGIDFVDISAVQGQEKDTVYLTFSKEYMDEKYREHFDDINVEDANEETEENKDIKIDLTDEDLNQLT